MKRTLLTLIALAAAMPALALPLHRVGTVTWHPTRYSGKVVRMEGYLLRREKGYILFSDEPGGSVSSHDLPVIGTGIETIRPKRKYILTGLFVKGGLRAANHNPYHLKLTAPPHRVGS
ncbi:hypothetical protein [Solirhodobacter olei]|uniref:hypothetical protein n=1 Tax=Solirhodobacter olei TaxID=2493082 RepID=UPI000FDCBB81|nr:hypothetical protein [Solirhodobacter olei]